MLVVTPATRFGSWAWLEKALAARPDIQATVVSYGRSATATPNVRFVSLPPLIDYGKWSPRLAERRFLALNLLYYAPLAPLAWLVALRRRPRVAVANGVNSAALLLPLTFVGCRVVLAFHGSIEHAGPAWHRVVRRLLSRIDRAFVNSVGSADDLAHVFDRSKIVVVEHWADDVFFEVPLERSAADRLRVLFVGRLDSEKFTQCLRVCERLAAEGVVELTAVGDGPLATRLGAPGLVHAGYVGDKQELAKLYGQADVVWAAADITYVAIPGIEGLAAGCPLVVSDVPAVFTHAQAGQKVPSGLIPAEVGRVVDGEEDAEALALLRGWAAEGIPDAVRAGCRAYAFEHHTVRNLAAFVNEIVPA